MLVLLGIGVIAGIVTAISPCVLPVLPIVLAGGASGRKPARIVTGLVASFVVFTLFASYVLHELGLPQDLLRNVAIALLFVMAGVLLVPQLGLLLERPFARLTRFRAGGGGFLLGASLGLVFVPCAGPAFGAVSAAANTTNFGWRTFALAIAYGIGAGIPMLVVALGGPAAAARLRGVGPRLRIASGLVIALATVGIVFHADEWLQKRIPDYTTSLQAVERSHSAQTQLAKLTGAKQLTVKKKTALPGLPDYGKAPELVPGGQWFNTKPLTLKELRGKVVLVDFWTYSCINCLRTLPHLEAWYAAYHSKGLEIIGVHTPEFAFEHVASNVGAAVKRLGIHYPVMQDNDYATWTAYNNQYWPAEYLIDRTGQVRHVHFGESSYDETQNLIKELLGTKVNAKNVPDLTPQGLATPESYLGYERLERFAGTTLKKNVYAKYMFPRAVPQNELAYAGNWNVMSQRIVAGSDARLRLHFVAQHVYLVLGGHGTVSKLVDGMPRGNVRVNSYRLYTLLDLFRPEDATLELHFTPGVQAYAFTFG
ncbi:MAG: cytochrome c biogenesis protein DipZ [Actinobacteria bacterium]|nr:cytochrome c biogenesis protein DipZ [Actinomycetota bacterium]MBV8395192.1 cytochrome c biogenesis protein DipZ [Actinomycetota bacterium]